MTPNGNNAITLEDNVWGGDIYPKLSWFKHDKVKNAHILVAGCGALGNEVLKNLVLFGVGHITIVDFDRVERSNLTRSVLFRQSDAAEGTYKVYAAAKRLKEINPDVEITPIIGDVAYSIGLATLRHTDVAIGCVDSRYARYCLNRLCMRAGIPWVDGGIDSLEGTARVFMPGKNCYACNLGPEGLREMSRRMSCSAAIRSNEAAGRVPTTPVIASIIAAVQVQEAMKLIHHEEMANGELKSLCGKLFYYEGQFISTKIINFAAYDNDCPIHEEWKPTLSAPITSTTKVAQALATLKELLKSEHVSISLRDFVFVDYIVNRATDEHTTTMLPSYLIADFIEADERLRQYSDKQFLQHGISRLDDSFPYPNLTLYDIGIVPHDILHCYTTCREIFVEMPKE